MQCNVSKQPAVALRHIYKAYTTHIQQQWTVAPWAVCEHILYGALISRRKTCHQRLNYIYLVSYIRRYIHTCKYLHRFQTSETFRINQVRLNPQLECINLAQQYTIYEQQVYIGKKNATRKKKNEPGWVWVGRMDRGSASILRDCCQEKKVQTRRTVHGYDIPSELGYSNPEVSEKTPPALCTNPLVRIVPTFRGTKPVGIDVIRLLQQV